MQRPDGSHNQGTSFGERLVSAFVAVLFFAPVLGLLWWGCNIGIAYLHAADWVIPARLL